MPTATKSLLYIALTTLIEQGHTKTRRSRANSVRNCSIPTLNYTDICGYVKMITNQPHWVSAMCPVRVPQQPVQIH